jgi:hypothetical protein
VQIDIGYGDAVTPGPVQSTYPTLLDNFPAPRLRTYPVYTVIAEKLHAVTVLGMTNTRMKDFLDLHVMLEREHLNSQTLAAAIAATFARRGTPPLLILPAGLSAAFAQDQSRQALWRAFANRNQLSVPPLPDLIDDLRKHLEPLLAPTRR